MGNLIAFIRNTKALEIGIVVAAFLLNTRRCLKAIEVCKECLIICDNMVQGSNPFVTLVYDTSYEIMFQAYCYIRDYPKAIHYGTKLLDLFRETGERFEEGRLSLAVATIFHCQRKYVEAQDLYEKAVKIMIETGNREDEAHAYVLLGGMCFQLSQYAKANDFFKKAIAMATEIGNRNDLALCYGHLGLVLFKLGEYNKAKKYYENALSINIEIGNRRNEPSNYKFLGDVLSSQGEYGKAKGYYEKALAISVEIGDRSGEASHLVCLGHLLHSLGEDFKAKDYYEKALMITKAVGDKEREASCYKYLVSVFDKSVDRHHKVKKYIEMALAIGIETGEKGEEAYCYIDLGTTLLSLGQEFTMAKEFYEKALAIVKEIGNRRSEAKAYQNLGHLFFIIGENIKAEEHLKKSLSIYREIGEGDEEFNCLCSLASTMLAERKMQNAFKYFFESIRKAEDLQVLLTDNDQFKILLKEKHSFPYRKLSMLLCAAKNHNTALYVVELGRARALADLMAAQYSLEKQISGDPQSWVGIEEIVKNERYCTCIYIAYYNRDLFLWILETSGAIHFRRITVNEQYGLILSLDKYFAKSFRSFGILSEEECEDRSLNVNQSKQKSSQEERLEALRLVEDDENENQETEPSLPLYYKMIIDPVVDLLKEPEIVIVPDPSLYQVPFAALVDDNGKFLSETFRIRIVPSLTTLKLIQDSPANYHSQTGALVVGDPKVGQVFYMGRPRSFSPLPGAREEAEMIGKALGILPLLGEHASKQAVLERINAVSLIHFAAHGNAERGEIALSPLRSSTRPPQEEEYLLTMSDISRVQLRAKLVVLSCCHSAKGQIRAEGVVGIARAFLGSGARSVLVALWAIQDKATVQFMGRFYEHLVRGESSSESLHEAMKWMRMNGYSDVEAWAPFMLIGDNVKFNFET